MAKGDRLQQCQDWEVREMRNAETVLNIIREDSRTVCNWRAVCDESRKHGSEGGLKEKCLRVTRRQPTLHPSLAENDFRAVVLW